MAERRMFSKQIIDSDAFLDMPLSTQALYFHLSMRADDDGFLNNAKKILRLIGANQNDYDLLLAKSFIIQFPDGICVIKHWRINNYLRADRYKETAYKEEKSMLEIKDNGRYSLKASTQDTTGIPDGYHLETQVSIGKDSIDKVRIGKESIGEDTAVCQEPETSPDHNPVISLILNDKTEYWIFDDQIELWAELFPAVDVMQELRKMKSWLDSNPSRRKTKRGILRFVNGWLSKEQDRPKPSKNVPGQFYDDMREWVDTHAGE